MIASGKPTTGRPKKDSYRSGRGKTICIRLSEEDYKKLDILSKFYGITKTDYLIQGINFGMETYKKLEKSG